VFFNELKGFIDLKKNESEMKKKRKLRNKRKSRSLF